MKKKLLLVAVLACLVGLFFGLGLDRYLTLESLKASRQAFLDIYQARPIMVLAVYFAGYVVMAGLSLPGAVVVSLAGGALFGLAVGTLTVSFASSLGATLACALARYLLRDAVRGRFAGVWEKVRLGLERDGALYLFSLRLIPVFPFFVVNIVMGLTDMPLHRFYLVSQLGMLPATIVFINAGSELGKLDSLSGILSPSLLISLALLGVFPLIAKKSLEFYRARRGGGA